MALITTSGKRSRIPAGLTRSSRPEQRTLLDFFRSFADSSAEFVVYDDGYRRWRYSYRQIATAAQAFSARLRGESIAKGEKVLFWSENRPEWLAAFWGCLPAGRDHSSRGLPLLCGGAAQHPASCSCPGDSGGRRGQTVRSRRGIPVWRLADIDISAQPAPCQQLRSVRTTSLRSSLLRARRRLPRA